MDLEKAARQTLKYLFSEYKKGPSVLYTINTVAKKNGTDPVILSDYMLENLLIRERWIYPNDVVACRITIKGIERIEPAYVHDRLNQIITRLGDAGSFKPLNEILEFKLEEFSIAMDLVTELANLGLVSIQNPGHSIVVELTPAGWKQYEKGHNSSMNP